MSNQMNSSKISGKIIFVFFFAFFFCLFSSAHASNPTTPITPNDNILDPGDPNTPWGGCTPTDSNCYVATPWTNIGDDIYYNGGNVGIGTDTPEAKLHVNGTLKVTGSSTLADITPDVAASTTSGVIKNTIGSDNAYGMGMAKGPDGFARIAYLSGSDSSLNYVKCNDEDCSSPTITHVADTYGAYNGSYIMTLGSDNFARITYMDTDGALQLVRCEDADCTSKTTTPIDENTDNGPGQYGQQVVMGDDGFPRVAYTDCGSDYDLHFVRFSGGDTVGVNTNLTTLTGVDPDCGTYQEVSMVIGSDHFARIIVNDYANDAALKMIRCTNADCTTFVVDTIDATAYYPGYYGMIIKMGGDGLPRIAYIDDDNYTLWYAVCTDIDCTSPTITQLTDTDGYLYNGFGMDLRTGDLASISFSANADDSVHIINCSNTTCSSSQDVQVDTLAYGMEGGGPVVIGDDNLPMMAYSDEDTAIKFARLLNIDGSSIASGNDIGSSGSKFNRIYGQTLNADQLFLNQNLGIGTTNPLTRLQVDAPAANTSAVLISDGLGTLDHTLVGGYGSLLTLNIANGDNDYQLTYINEDATSGGKIANYQFSGNSLKFDHYSLDDELMGINYLLGYGGFGFSKAGSLVTRGIYPSGTNDLAIGRITDFSDPTNNTSYATFLNNGNVGIGTTDPQQKLSVSGNIYSTGSIRVGSNGGTDFGYSFIRNSATGLLDFTGDQGGFEGYNFKQSNNNSLLLINPNGNVGIGETNPSGKLSITTVAGDGNTSPLIVNASPVISAGGINLLDFTVTTTGLTGSAGWRGLSINATGTAAPGAAYYLKFEKDNTNIFSLDSSGEINLTPTSYSGFGTINYNGSSTGGLGFLRGTNLQTGLLLRNALPTDDGTGIGFQLLTTDNSAYGSLSNTGAKILSLGNGMSGNVAATETAWFKANGEAYVSGELGINNPTPSVALDVTGDIEYTGTITDVSDMRLKENITDFSGGLDIINSIGVKNYNMIVSPDKPETGFIAQNVQEFFPQAVSIVDPTNGYLGVSYVSFIPVLAKGIQELDLNLNQIAGTNTLNTEASDAFTTSFFQNVFAKVSEWMADAENNISEIIAGTFRAKEKLCINDTCVTEDQLKTLLENSGVNNTPSSPSTETPPPAEDNTPTPPLEPTDPTDSASNGASTTPSIPLETGSDSSGSAVSNGTTPPPADTTSSTESN